ncbi:NAD(P)/FAD-dependent oxidoreductase [Candidatus Rhodobacter oscarellae]|nr:FAD-dependent oxidoreductase [Candidatus Rhodobacter lobularis]
MNEILIIGGGILGATLARELARRGARPVIVDADTPDRRTSLGSLGWLNASSTADMGYAQLRRASMELWHALKDAHPDCPAFFPGALLWGDDAGAVRAQEERMNALGWAALALDRAALEARIPGLNAPEAALLLPREGYADPARITDWMTAQALAAGAWLIRGLVETVEAGRVTLASGEQLEAAKTVICAGNATGDLLASAGIDVPLRQSPGILMRTAPLPIQLPCVMATPKLDLWQGADGAVLMSSSLAKTPERADDLMASDAAAALRALVPGLTEAPVVEVTRRNRPIPKDGFPIVGPSGLDGVWLAVTHSGMTLAPVIAEALADNLTGQPARHDLGRYGLGRDWASPHERAAL